jgi:acyl-CoA thioester hydrolase
MPAFRTTRRVEFRDTDAAGLVHFSVFFNYMEQAEHEYLRHVGLSVLYCDEQGPISWPRVAASCEYTGAVKFEDLLDIELRVERLGSKSVTYGFTFTHAGRLVATGRITAVCCRLEPNGPPRSVAVPAAIAARINGADPPSGEMG